MRALDGTQAPCRQERMDVGVSPDGPPRRSVGTIVARWSTRPATTTSTMCDECGEALEPGATRCPQCRQAVPVVPAGMLAALLETASGERRLVIAESTPGGGWAAARVVPATPSAVRAVARQDRTRGGAA